MTLMALLIIAGIQVLLFGFLGTQLVGLRKEIYKVQRENKSLERKVDALHLAQAEKTPEPAKKPASGTRNAGAPVSTSRPNPVRRR
jgi:hypothetical protein